MRLLAFSSVDLGVFFQEDNWEINNHFIQLHEGREIQEGLLEGNEQLADNRAVVHVVPALYCPWQWGWWRVKLTAHWHLWNRNPPDECRVNIRQTDMLFMFNQGIWVRHVHLEDEVNPSGFSTGEHVVRVISSDSVGFKQILPKLVFSQLGSRTSWCWSCAELLWMYKHKEGQWSCMQAVD